MEFFDLVKTNRADLDAKPRIRTANKTVLVTLPKPLALRAGLALAGKVKVQFGRGEGSQCALRITPDPAGHWIPVARKNVIQVYVTEIYPTVEIKDRALDYVVAKDGLTLTLPTPWILENEHLLTAPKAPGKRGKAQ